VERLRYVEEGTVPGDKTLIKDHMRSPVLTVSAEAGLDRALQIMRTRRIRHLPVVDDAQMMVGFISARDLRMSMEEMEKGPAGAPKGYYLPALKKVKSVMTTAVATVTPETPLWQAAEIMSEKKFGALPVVEPGTAKLVGMISETDMLHILVKMLRERQA
jgi:CBS domain-containing protein